METLSDMSAANATLSQKQILTKAMILAKEAVTWDTNNKYSEAIVAYEQSTTLIAEVLQQLRQGESDKQREEYRRLKGIVSAFQIEYSSL
jgi:glucose-6-phosphate isomerase